MNAQLLFLRSNFLTIMRKTYLFVASMALFSAFTFSSCEKIKEKAFESFSAKGADIQFTIPVVASTNEATLGSAQISLNVDSTIKASTGGLFGINILKQVNPEEVTLTLLNSDASNNLANFESLKVKVSANGGSAVEIASINNPDTQRSSVVIPVDNTKQLINFLKTAPVQYEIVGKARRTTNKQLQAQLVVKLKFK